MVQEVIDDSQEQPAAETPARVVRRRRKKRPEPSETPTGGDGSAQPGPPEVRPEAAKAGAAEPQSSTDAGQAGSAAGQAEATPRGDESRIKTRRRGRRSKPQTAPVEGEAAVTSQGPAAQTTDQPSEPKRPSRKRRRPGRKEQITGPPVTAEQMMLITVRGERSQVALMEGRELVQHYVTHAENRSIAGNVYLGRVQNVLPGMEAAFVDIGEEKNAILYAGELSFDEELEGPAPRIEAMLKSGQAVLTQVTKDPMGSKGARLTTEVSVAGRYLVLVPRAGSLGISRRLSDSERRRLREIALKIRPEGHGLIVRTAAEGATEQDLELDVQRLVRIWTEIEETSTKVKPGKLVHREPNLVMRVVRDLFTADISKVLVEDGEIYEELREYVEEVAPSLSDRLEKYEDSSPLFEKYEVNEQLRKAVDRKVWLKSGGHIVIDRAEALTVIDVNTGRFVGKSNLEQTVLHTNLEAAREIAKQLRLRDIGGIIVIDFIDMAIQRNRGEVVRVLNEALARDKTRTQVFGISDLGLLQMTRKRVSEGLLEAFSESCPNCEGRGILLKDLG